MAKPISVGLTIRLAHNGQFSSTRSHLSVTRRKAGSILVECGQVNERVQGEREGDRKVQEERAPPYS